jgi:7-cyano-7-deazaguanine synthase
VTVLLLSGGIDSGAAYAWLRENRRVLPCFVDYGQRASHVEQESAAEIAQHFGDKLLVRHARLNGSLVGGEFEHGREARDIELDPLPLSYVPARNLLLLSIAVNVAVEYKHTSVCIGANADDQLGYPDCRKEFFDAFSNAIKWGVRERVDILTPFVGDSKAEVARFARVRGVPVSATTSCYVGTNCGQCDSCVLRGAALRCL